MTETLTGRKECLLVKIGTMTANILTRQFNRSLFRTIFHRCIFGRARQEGDVPNGICIPGGDGRGANL